MANWDDLTTAIGDTPSHPIDHRIDPRKGNEKVGIVKYLDHPKKGRIFASICWTQISRRGISKYPRHPKKENHRKQFYTFSDKRGDLFGGGSSKYRSHLEGTATDAVHLARYSNAAVIDKLIVIIIVSIGKNVDNESSNTAATPSRSPSPSPHVVRGASSSSSSKSAQGWKSAEGVSSGRSLIRYPDLSSKL